MTLEDAANVIIAWLRTKSIAFLAPQDGEVLGPSHFRLQVEQLSPIARTRVFEVMPLDIADCYEVKELEAA